MEYGNFIKLFWLVYRLLPLSVNGIGDKLKVNYPIETNVVSIA